MLVHMRRALVVARPAIAGSSVRLVRHKASIPAVQMVEDALPTLATKSAKAVRKEEKQAEAAEALYESLSPALKQSLATMNIKTLFPVQSQTLEACRAGKDLVVRSKTGSGKTVAFALPTVEKLMAMKPSKARGTPRAMVLAPTRELALQVHREFEKLAPGLNCVAVYGGASIVTQQQQLRGLVDVVVATPGRMKDFIDRGTLDLSQISVAILDEADEMLKVGFYEAIQEIYEALPSKSERQNLLFSATVSREVRQICDSFLNKPTFVDLVGEDTSKIADSIEMNVTPVTRDSKEAALSAILAAHSTGSTKSNPKRALVFCTTKRECEELSRTFHSPDSTLSGGALHGDMSQAAREEMLGRFRDGSCLVLVATDVAARGLDIPQVDLVIHYSLPRDHDSFVHRSGRTGRAGRKGTNIIFYDPSRERYELDELQRSVGMKFAIRAVPCGPEVVRAQAEVVAKNLSNITGSMLQWIKPVADELRMKDTEKGTDSLAAALAALLGGNTKLKSFSALNGRTGNQTLKVERIEKGDKLDVDAVTKFMKSLPSYKEGLKGSLVRELHRVVQSSAVLVDVAETYVGDMLANAEKAGLKVEVVGGIVPESRREFVEERARSSHHTSASAANRRDGGKAFHSRHGGSSGGDRRGSYGGGGDRRGSFGGSGDRRGGYGGDRRASDRDRGRGSSRSSSGRNRGDNF